MRYMSLGSSAVTVIEALEARQMLSVSLPNALHVNAGGPVVVDSIGREFEADSGFTGGTTGTQTAVDLNGQPAEPIFGTYRQGTNFSFSKPIANGRYALFLEFADASVSPADRRFNVVGEGQPLLSNFSPIGHGVGVAYERSFNLTIHDETLDLQFTGASGDAIVSGIVLVPVDIPVEAQPYSWTALSDGSRTIQSANSLRQIGMGILFYRNENRGAYPSSLLSIFDHLGQKLSTFASPRTDTLVPRGELTAGESLAWIARKLDYIYVGDSLNNRSSPDAVVAFENPDRVAGGLNILFADGRVEFHERADAAALIGFDPNVPPAGGAPFQTTLPADPKYLQGQMNLRNIGQALLLHANSNRQRLPNEPGPLVSFGATAAHFVNPRGTTPLPPSGMTIDETKAYVNASTDYRFLAGGFNANVSTNHVLLYDNPDDFTDGVQFLFGDGSTEFREQRWAMETLRRTSLRYYMGQPATQPLAELAGVKLLSEGESVQLNGAGVTLQIPLSGSRGTPIPIVSYEWDFDYDGQSFTTDATGRQPTYVAPSVDGDMTRTLALRVTDANGAQGVATTIVQVRDVPPPVVNVAIVDNDSPNVVRTGTWGTSTGVAGYFGSDYLHDNKANKGKMSVAYTAALTAGRYEVYAWWPARSDRASKVPFDIKHAGGTATVFKDQRYNGGKWNLLGIYGFASDGTVTIRNGGTTGYVGADAVRFVRTTTPSTPVEIVMDNKSTGVSRIGTWTSSTVDKHYLGTDYLHDGNTGKGTKSVTYTPTLPTSGRYQVWARWTSAANKSSKTPFDITHANGTTTVIKNQRKEGGTWVLLGEFDFLATGGKLTIRTTGTDGYVVADGVKFVSV